MRLADDPTLIPRRADIHPTENPVYLHALSQAPVIDGFDDDWQHFGLSPSPMIAARAASIDSPVLATEMTGGIYRSQLYLLLQIADASFDRLNPGEDPLRSGDYLRVVRANQPDLYLGASAPGNINARYLEGGQIRQEYGLSGVWNHTGEHYLIELRIRPRLLEQTLGFEFVSRDASAGERHIRIGMRGDRALPYIAADARLAEVLAVFAPGGLRLSVVDTQGWLLASEGSLEASNRFNNLEDSYRDQSERASVAASNAPGWLTRFYRQLLKDRDSEHLSPWHLSGRLDGADVSEALGGRALSSRFSFGEHKVGRGIVPIIRDSSLIGVVVAEQTSDSLTTSTNTAFNRLLFWTLFSILTVGLGLLAYASLLSLRIRRLSKAAEVAIDDGGNLTKDFPVSGFNDEIGDLSRSYDRLLQRLRDYTEYLKTLSSKLSHELKTPLAVVRSSLDNLEQEELSDSARVYAGRASDGAARLSAIFAALSSASRLEQSIQGAEFEIIDLAELVEAISKAYADAYPNHRITLLLPTEAPLSVRIAPELVVQMLDKLVANAVDFCPENGAIELSLTPTEDQLKLCVSNEGPPLPEEMKSQLFDTLVSVRGAGEEEMHLGLGLYIARLIAEFHDGSIRLENRPDGKGVNAMVCFPYQARQK
eukprot:g4532.t1